MSASPFSMTAASALWKREMVRFFRQPSRIIGALGTPLLFWLLIGCGIGSSFRAGNYSKGGSGYLLYFFPGTIMMILLFTAIFSTISLIEDRHAGFLQSVLVAPISRSSFVLGKILGGATLAALQGFLFLLLAPFAGLHMAAGAWVLTAVVICLNAFSLTCLGFIIAWRMHSIQGFHAIMNLFLMPLWFLSGALFPAEGAPYWLGLVMKLNPLSYGMAALRIAMHGENPGLADLPALGLSLAVTIIFGIVLFMMSSLISSRRTVEDAS